MKKQKTIIYVDGFNLYYGCLKNSTYKWLDLKKLFVDLLDESHEIVAIKYFTAYISSRAGNENSIALHVLNDAWLKVYDCAVLVSNDSDLSESLKMVKAQHKFNIGLIFPNTDAKRRPSHQLTQHADFVKRIRPGALAKAQLPKQIPGTEITKPADWC